MTYRISFQSRANDGVYILVNGACCAGAFRDESTAKAYLSSSYEEIISNYRERHSWARAVMGELS